MAEILPSDPVEIKKKKNMHILGQKRGHDVRTAIVAKARRQLNADVLLPGSVQIAYQSNVAWTDTDLTSLLKNGDSLRLGTFVTKVDCVNRPFNAKRIPLSDFWDRNNADGIPIYKILTLDDIASQMKPKKKEKEEEVVVELESREEKQRKKKLLEDAKYWGETSLWEVLVDGDSGQMYYFNKLTEQTQWEKPSCFIKLEEEKAEELKKIKAQSMRKRQKRLNSKGDFKSRRRRLQKGREAEKQRKEEERQQRLEENAMALER